MQRLFDIVTESSCDVPQSFFEERELTCVPLGFIMDGVNYEGVDGEHIDVKDFYNKLREGKMPSTYQITAEVAKSYLEKSLKAGRDVLVVAFSSGLSGTAGQFAVAAKELGETYPDRKIIVVDSLCASMGEGLLVDYVVKKASTGASIEDTAAYAENLKLSICHLFTVDDLVHLKRGGRCSATSAIIGSILKIKPIMHMNNEGKLEVTSKTVGRKKAINTLVEGLLEVQAMDDDDPIFLSHGDCEEDAEYAIGLLRKHFPNKEIVKSTIGAVIGTHSGPGTLALFCKAKRR